MSRNRSTRRSGSRWPWRRGKRVDPLRRLEQFNVATGSPQPDGRSTRPRATRRRLAFWARAARTAQPDASASTPPPEGQRRSSRSTRKGVQPAAAPPPTPPPVRTRRRAVTPAAPAAPTSAEPSGRRSRRAAATQERARKKAERAQESERAKEAERVRKEEERVRREAARAQEVERAKEAERTKEAERVRKEQEALQAKEAERVRKEQERARREADALRAKEEAERAKAEERARQEADRARKEEERIRREAEALAAKEEAERAKAEERARQEAERVRKEEEAARAKEMERAREEADAARVREEAARARAEVERAKEEERARKDQERASRKRTRTRGRRRFRRRERQDQMELGIAKSAPPGSKTKPPRRRPRTEQPEADLQPAAAVSTAPDDARAEQLVLVSADEKEANLTAPSTITNADLVNEAVAGLFSRPTRTILTVLGTMIGLTALVATLGLSRTANSRIAGRFDEIAATEVVVAPRPVDITAQNNDIPWDAGERLRRLNGVVAAGTLSKVDVGSALVTASPVKEPGKRTDFKLSVQAASPSLFSAVRAQLGTGRLPDEGHSRRHERVAVLGRNAADDLGIGDLARLPAISIGADTFLVIGIVDTVARQERLLSSVMIPEGTARELYRLQRPDLAVIETAIGANALIADQAPIALRPDNAEGLKVTQQAELRQVRENVTGDLDLLFLMLGGVSLLVGAIGIANVTLVSVMERTGEIGLRRALGATRRHIARQFLLESTAMGFVGGILGASLGILIVVAVSALQGWSPVLDPLTPFAAPVIGGVIGLVAGSYPAHRAASLEPVEALRAGT